MASVREVARQVIREQGFTREDVGKLRMQQTILNAHLIQEKTARNYALTSRGRILLSDRSAIDPLAYATLTAADEEDARAKVAQLSRSPEFERALPIYRKASFILLSPVVEWRFDDGVRTMDDVVESPNVFRKLLANFGIPYREIGEEMKDLGERTVATLEYAGLSMRMG